MLPDAQQEEATVQIGDEVWVKAPDACCTTQWGRGVVTDINSRNKISIDGIPRHTLDIRPVNVLDNEREDGRSRSNEAVRRSLRERWPPMWTHDYIMG